MKKITTLLVAFFAIITLVGCGDQNDVTPSSFKLSATTVQVTTMGGMATVKLDAPGPWKTTVADDSKAWLTIKPASGTGGVNQVIELTASVLEEGQPLSGKVTFIMADGSGTTIDLKIERIEAKPSRQGDSLALVALYNSAGGSKWTLNRWNLTKQMRDWSGITLELRGGEWRVTQIVLPGENLGGTLPEAMGVMTELEVLMLGRKFWPESERPKYLLSGKIPDAIWTLPKLQTLDLSFQNIEGPINPAVFTSSPDFKHLVLPGANLDCEIPQEIGQATNLEYLVAQMSNLRGEIPQSMSKLTKLNRVEIDHNNLTGVIPSFNASKGLYSVILSYQGELELVTENQGSGLYNLLTGEPRVLQYYKRVSGGFTGSNLVFEDMPTLAVVDLSATDITVSPAISNTPKLELIGFNNNLRLESLHPSTYMVKSAKTLQAYNCAINVLPQEMDLPVLQDFLFYKNKIASVPASIGSCKELQNLWLNDNLFTELPDVFEPMSFLRTAYLGHCKLASVPASLWSRSSLLELELHNNEIDGELPETFTSLSQLGVFTISNNKMTGPINSLTTIRSGQQIFAHNNQFTGIIPNGDVTVEGYETKPSIGHLSFTKHLTLANNNLEGPIPGAFNLCNNLNRLTLSGNQLSGDIDPLVTGRNNWCGFDPLVNIIPQQEPYKLNYVDACK